MPQTTLITRDTPLPAGWRYSVMRKLAMALHLYHDLWSQFQTLGIHHPRYNHCQACLY